jgi:hypothetical protein
MSVASCGCSSSLFLFNIVCTGSTALTAVIFLLHSPRRESVIARAPAERQCTLRGLQGETARGACLCVAKREREREGKGENESTEALGKEKGMSLASRQASRQATAPASRGARCKITFVFRFKLTVAHRISRPLNALGMKCFLSFHYI